MAESARAKRAAALEEKKKRLEALKARRAERAAGAGAGGASAASAGGGSAPSRGTGGNLDDYIDGLLKSDAPAVPGVEPPKPSAAVAATSEAVSAETSTSAGATAEAGEASPKDTESGEGKEQVTTGTSAAAAPAPAPAPVRKVETFTMSTQTEEEDFPPALDDEDDDEETKRKQAEAAAAAASTSAGAGDGEDNDSEKGTQTMPIAQLDPNSLSETISSRPFQHFLNSASKKVEKVLGAGALAELLDDPAYDDEADDDDDGDIADDGVGEDGGAGTASEGEDGGTTPKRAKKTKGRRLGLLGGKTSADGALDATGIVKSSQTYSCPRWTANRDLTSITWSPHRREMLVASYQSSSSAAGGTGGASVDAAVRAVSPADTPSSSLIPQSSELRSDGLALVWNLALPDRPEHIFCCGSPVLTTAFHPTELPLVIGGCHSGQVVVWDVRAGRLPVQRSVGPAGGGHAHPICSMEVVESGVSNKNVCGMWDAYLLAVIGMQFPSSQSHFTFFLWPHITSLRS